MQPDLIGGRYRVGTAIGQGGMGTVWLCRDETLQRDVAVKQVGLLPGRVGHRLGARAARGALVGGAEPPQRGHRLRRRRGGPARSGW